jgi:pSer/pThr/pTyr-binding forkhead associated (FHA) protein
MTCALYGFVGWAIYVLWHDLHSQGMMLNKRKIPTLRLTWLFDQQEKSRDYAIPEVSIGRDPSCACPLDDETISARHAHLVYHHNQWWLEDLQSTNGTFLNQERLDIPTVVVSGDEIRCGQINLVVDIHQE